MDYNKRITELREERGWSEYKLSEKSNVSQGTLSTINRHKDITLSTIQKLCDAFDITLSQFFYEGGELLEITPEQLEFLNLFNAITPEQKGIIINTMKSFVK